MATHAQEAPLACGCCCGDLTEDKFAWYARCPLCGCLNPLARAGRCAVEEPRFRVLAAGIKGAAADFPAKPAA